MAAPVDRRLLRESRAARSHLALAGLLGALEAALILAQAVLLAYVIAHAAIDHATLAALRGELIALAAVLLARAAVSGGFELSGRWGATRVMSELRRRLVGALLVDGVGVDREERSGELAAAAVQGVDALESYFAGYLPQFVLAALVPLAVLGWVLPLDPIAAGILAFTVPLLILFMVLVGRGAQAHTRQRWRALSLLSAHFLDVVRGLPTLRAYRRDRAQEAILGTVGERYRAETMGTLRIAFLSALVLELCAMIGTALVAATIGVQLVDGALGLQAGLTVLLLAPELYGPLRQVGQQFHASADGAAAAERIFAVLDRPPALAPARAAGEVVVPDPRFESIRFRAVSFAYPRRPGAVLDGVDLELAPGETTALVGPSGAGKSTLAALLMRLADPTAGAIECGGRDLRMLPIERWRARTAWVPQEPTLFAGTVAENIALGDPGADRGRIERAARDAGIWDAIERLPHGIETMLGDGARRLSAGQRRRIALARAFLRNAPLLVLDEPTAHLDEASAADIASAVARLARGRTVLAIVHQPALAAHADRVVELREGRIVGVTSPAAQAVRAAAPTEARSDEDAPTRAASDAAVPV
ncbi:MAG TPA: thiol reductant ABC exporter subunit CydD [Solirubrobacteraceae bacterium]|nr:thiol reductant ABC exporter subunit CydD [Solirubrobacteraceae bacterium]